MLVPVVLPTPDRYQGRGLQGRRKSLPGPRRRSFRGRVESLEGRALMSFGTGGIVTTQTIGGVTPIMSALAIQPADQKIVVAGSESNSSAFSLVRYNTVGSIDTSFGSGGLVTTSFGKSHLDGINSVVIQANGKIVAGGGDQIYNSKTNSYQGQFALARYNSAGSLDTSFGSGGKVTTSFPSSAGVATIGTVLLRSDGEVAAVGSAGANSLTPSVALALYQSSGALNTGFGKSGTVLDSSKNSSTTTTNSQGGTTTVYRYFTPSGAVLESDNSILVAGTYVTRTKTTASSGSVTWTTNEQDLALAHYLATGAIDSSFGTGGIAIDPITPTGVATSHATGSSVVVQPNGAIVEVGSATGSNGYSDLLVARFNPSGALDSTFGSGTGYTLIDMGVGSGGSTALIQPNGQIVAAGWVGMYPSTAFGTARLNADGTPDTSFGTNGVATTHVLYSLHDGHVLAGLETINSQTMIVDGAMAVTSSNGAEAMALVRYTPNGALDSGTLAVTATATASFSTSNAAAKVSSAGLSPGGALAGTAAGRRSTGLDGSMPVVPSIIPIGGLVAQALDSPGFLDTLLPGRKRR